jgi:glycosyltransferase involved in cell wall biosynthesis
MKATVLILSKNNAETIGDCITSVLMQKEDIQEIILLDGFSSDNTTGIALETFHQKNFQDFVIQNYGE